MSRKSTMGERLRSARCAARMSPAAVAKALRTTARTVYRYESDDQSPPLERLARLARLYGRSADWIILGGPVRTIND